MKELVLGIIRHLLTAAGGALIGGTELGLDVGGEDISAVVGAIVTVIGVAWSVYEKRRARKAGG